jgi:hypothetical protein
VTATVAPASSSTLRQGAHATRAAAFSIQKLSAEAALLLAILRLLLLGVGSDDAVEGLLPLSATPVAAAPVTAAVASAESSS